MKNLVGKRVKVRLLLANGMNSKELDFDGKVEKIEKNLIFLTEVSRYDCSVRRLPDQVINTSSLAFVRLETLD